MGLGKGKRFARPMCSRESPALEPKLLMKTDRSSLSIPAAGTSSLQQAPVKHPWSFAARQVAGGAWQVADRARESGHGWGPGFLPTVLGTAREHVPDSLVSGPMSPACPLAFAIKLSSLSASFPPKPSPQDRQGWCASSFMDVAVLFTLCFQDH